MLASLFCYFVALALGILGGWFFPWWLNLFIFVLFSGIYFYASRNKLYKLFDIMTLGFLVWLFPIIIAHTSDISSFIAKLIEMVA